MSESSSDSNASPSPEAPAAEPGPEAVIPVELTAVNPIARVVRMVLQLALAVVLLMGGLHLRDSFMSDDGEGRGRFGGPGGGPGVERNATLVEVTTVSRGDEPVRVHASGAIVPARSIGLHPRVNGEVVEVHPDFEPGGFVAEGDLVVRFDDTDYRLAVRQARANRSGARAGRRVEEGNQEIARNEFELYGQEDLAEDARDLVLRQPQLDAAEASYEAADAQYDMARTNLTRTRVTAPFDAVIDEVGVQVGSRASESTELARLVGTDTFWVEAAVPLDLLGWIEAGDDHNGGRRSAVEVRLPSVWGPDVYREGRVLRVLPSLETAGRMARVLVAVDDPLCRRPENADAPRLFLGAWVELTIVGRELPNVVALDRSLLREGRSAWVLDSEARLSIRDLEIAYRGRDRVLISSGLVDGDQVVATNLAAPVEGMGLRTPDMPAPGNAPERSGEGSGLGAGEEASRADHGASAGNRGGSRGGPP